MTPFEIRSRSRLIALKNVKAPQGTTFEPETNTYVPIVKDERLLIDKAVDVATKLTKLPGEFVTETKDVINVASDLVTLGLEAAGTNQDYSPPSLPRIRVELLGDAKKKFPGVVSVKKVHEQILVQGIQVLGQRMAKVQIELIEGIEKSVEEFAKKTAVTLGVKIFAKAAVFAVLKELIDTVAKGLSAYGNAKTQAKIEAGIREESAASMIKFAKRAAYNQHQKFKDGATRVAKIVMSRQPKKSDATT
jgi:hypothetical protein